MKRRAISYSAAELRFVEARRGLSRRDLHAAFVLQFNRTDVSCDNLKSLCTRSGWTTGRSRWCSDDDALLRDLYPDTSTEGVARRIGRSLASTYNRARILGLSKSGAYLASPAACRLRRGDNVGAACRFQKGHVPANKGKPMLFHPNSAATRFKKGQRGSKWVPIGSERLVDGYHYTKISDVRCVPWTVNWKPTHVLRWERVHGAVSKGMALKSLDGNRLNTDPSNWELISRALLPRLNGRFGRDYDRAPAELKPTILAVARLEHAAAVASSVRRPA